MDTGSLLSQLAHAILLPLILGGLALVFPYRKTAVLRPLTPQVMKAIQGSIQKYNWLGLLLFFLTVPLTGWLVYDFLKTVHHLLPKPSDAFSHAFPFDESFWLLPGVSIGFGVAMPVMAALGRKFYGTEQYALINHAYNQQYGFDGELVSRWITRLFVGLGIVSIGLCYNMYAGLQGREMVINRFLDIRERRYAFDQIDRLTYVDYRMVNQYKEDRIAYYEVSYRDGFVWDTHEFLRSVPIESDQPVVEYLSQQTGVRIDSTERVKRLNQ